MNSRNKKLFIALLAVGMATSLAACGTAKQESHAASEAITESVAVESEQADITEDGSGNETKVEITENGSDSEAGAEQIEIEMAFGDTVMTAALDDSETSRAFIEMLPLTLSMSRYADREYYAAIDELPENGEAIEDFENGDVTYYTAGKSLAIFFGNADTSSQSGLIRMGRITSDLRLFDSVGENVEVKISLLESEADMANLDFSIFSNVEITGLDLSALGEEERSVLYQQTRYCQAMTEADTETMTEITSPDMVFTHMSGRQQTREEYFADIADGSLQYFTIGIENPVVEVDGEYASVTYTSVLNANAYGARGTYRIDGTHWYERQDGGWIACNAPEQ